MKALIILRHINSIETVRLYLMERGIECSHVVLDPIELPENTETAIQFISKLLAEKPDLIIAGTKIFETDNQDKLAQPLRLIEFLKFLHSEGAGQTPICLTHLMEMPQGLRTEIDKTGLNIHIVENDNLKRDGMSNLGPLIMTALMLKV